MKQVREGQVRDRRGSVYFICAKGAGRIKIGRSKNPAKRLADLQCASPEPLELLVSYEVDDCEAEEGRLHEMFALSRSHGEWFHISGELARLIARLRAAVAENDGAMMVGAVAAFAPSIDPRLTGPRLLTSALDFSAVFDVWEAGTRPSRLLDRLTPTVVRAGDRLGWNPAVFRGDFWPAEEFEERSISIARRGGVGWRWEFNRPRAGTLHTAELLARAKDDRDRVAILLLALQQAMRERASSLPKSWRGVAWDFFEHCADLAAKHAVDAGFDRFALEWPRMSTGAFPGLDRFVAEKTPPGSLWGVFAALHVQTVALITSHRLVRFLPADETDVT